jgi:peptidoglycan/LPS O-acetylase OafA/YrhL
VRMRSPIGTRVLRGLGKQSYLIFLLHYPIMAFAVGPIFPVAMHPVVLLATGLVFVAGVYALCSLISRPMDGLTSRLYRLVPRLAEPRAVK